MNKTQGVAKYEPEWITHKEAAAWLGVHPITLWKWRIKFNLNWTSMGNKVIFYDKKQLIEILNKNSSHAVLQKTQTA